MVGKMKQKVVIIGIYENNRLAMIRPLGKIGYDIDVIALGNRVSKKGVDSYSKYVSNYYQCKEDEGLGVVDFLMNLCKDHSQKAVLIPVDDFSVVLLDNNYNILKDNFLLPNIHEEQGAIVKWMNKDVQKTHALKCGLNVVDSKTVEIVKGAYILPTGISYPCFPKTQYYVKGAKQFLRKCSDETELIRVLDSICGLQNDVIVIIEDFKEIEREFSIGGFSDGNNVVISGVIEKQTISNGVTMTGRIVPISGYEVLVDKYKNFIRSIGFWGVFDFDLFRSGDEFYFCELNLRYGGTGYAYIKKGINLPEMLVRSLRGNPVEDININISTVSSFVNEKVCLKSWYKGKMTTKEYLRVMESSDLFLYKDDNDPIPGQLFVKRMKNLRLRRFIRKVLKSISGNT